mgnify:CR=1 FL=1
MSTEDLTVQMQRLEANVSHLDRLVEQLNEALVGQGRQLTRLQKRVEQLGETLEARENPASSVPIERPPHYGR